MKKSLENKLRLAYQAGHQRGVFDGLNNYFDAPLDEDEYIDSLKKSNEIIEEKVSFTYSFLNYKLGWEKFCDLTGTNEWAKNEGREFKDGEIYSLTISQAKEYKLL